MKEIIIEGARIDSREELHKVFKDALELPDYYGGILDALWDMLTGEIDLTVRIVWRDFNITKENIGGYATKVSEIIIRASRAVENNIFYTLED